MNTGLLIRLVVGLLCWSGITVAVSVMLSVLLCLRAVERRRVRTSRDGARSLRDALNRQARGPQLEEADRKERQQKQRLFRLWQQQNPASQAEPAEDPWRESPARSWPDDSHGELPDAGNRHVE